MDQQIRKRDSQINIVLNQREKKEPLGVKRKQQIETFVERTIPAEHHLLQRVEQQLDGMVGLIEIKKIVKEIYAWMYVNRKRREHGLSVQHQSMHMLFKGNPGTGKTTVARILARLFKEMHVLSKGHLVEAERADVVGEYIGHTAQKTRKLIEEAKGGVLFIDEAYSLARGGEKDFGKEAIDTLVKAMEDKKNEFILILAGYSNEMDQFLSLNPGLPSRFPFVMEFPDYSIDELLKIASIMVDEREYCFSKDAEFKLKDYIMQEKYSRSGTFNNARFVRNVIEKAIRTQAVRLLNESGPNREQLMTLVKEDFQFK
ncbi:stage V sporulation protein K [Lottiidibacillus patelloidae]|uniref:Stage V sporulation protein K n=1 Tax=Lottiidibacillus patelloidae TaxID=2670334 RepID=A0A263BY74_9BACI|nr:stage V sporulation protein K [Lottiidibacillus patelloidae]OZM58664.1 stage V sporulation protein K [Lottiidibacillus patelloidae]